MLFPCFCFGLTKFEFQRAERFIGAETLAKLRQASADNFAKYLHFGKVSYSYSFV